MALFSVLRGRVYRLIAIDILLRPSKIWLLKGVRQMTKDEALRMAIEVFDMYGNKMNSAFADEAYQACKDALEQPAQKLVGYIGVISLQRINSNYSGIDSYGISLEKLLENDIPLYTHHAPSREWVGLSDEERYLNEGRSPEEIEYARAIEAKLREKNNGT